MKYLNRSYKASPTWLYLQVIGHSMEREHDELNERIKDLNLYVDLSKIMVPNSGLTYYASDKKQVMTLSTVDKNCKIQITLPDNLFEWFIDVFDITGQKLVSTWVDHYGDTHENLIIEMRNEITGFLKIVSENKTRVIDLADNKKTFQYFDNEAWRNVELFQ